MGITLLAKVPAGREEMEGVRVRPNMLAPDKVGTLSDEENSTAEVAYCQGAPSLSLKRSSAVRGDEQVQSHEMLSLGDVGSP